MEDEGPGLGVTVSLQSLQSSQECAIHHAVTVGAARSVDG